MSKTTLAAVNKALKNLGVQERLVQGDGYFYFAEGSSPLWKESSVYVYTVDALTVPQWIEEYNEFIRKWLDNSNK